MSRGYRYLLVVLVGLTSTALVLVVSGGYLDSVITEVRGAAPAQASAVEIAGVTHGNGMDPNMPMPGMHGSNMQMSPGGSADAVPTRQEYAGSTNHAPKRS